MWATHGNSVAMRSKPALYSCLWVVWPLLTKISLRGAVCLWILCRQIYCTSPDALAVSNLVFHTELTGYDGHFTILWHLLAVCLLLLLVLNTSQRVLACLFPTCGLPGNIWEVATVGRESWSLWFDPVGFALCSYDKSSSNLICGRNRYMYQKLRKFQRLFTLPSKWGI